MNRNRTVYQQRIAPTFGSWLVAQVGRRNLEKWASETDGSESAHRVAIKIVKAMFGFAYRQGILDGDP